MFNRSSWMKNLWRDENYRTSQVYAHLGKPSPKKGKAGKKLSPELKQVAVTNLLNGLTNYWIENKQYNQTRWNDLYESWRDAIFQRDNRICQFCRIEIIQSSSCHAHHLYSWEEHPELRYEKTNGICLCSKCHKKIDFISTKIDKAIALLQLSERISAASRQHDLSDYDLYESLVELQRVICFSSIMNEHKNTAAIDFIISNRSKVKISDSEIPSRQIKNSESLLLQLKKYR